VGGLLIPYDWCPSEDCHVTERHVMRYVKAAIGVIQWQAKKA
jgi:hypothetical protein